MESIDIGQKLREARLRSNLTQEQAADALRVSRQTVSNWETGKTYPDIVSVIRMSDLYKVSLDHLLKGDTDMKGDYIEYLEESTNTVKSRNRLGKIILISTYILVYALGLAVYFFASDPGDYMGYSLVFFWLLYPVTTFVISLLISIFGYWGKLRFITAPVMGIVFTLSEYVTQIGYMKTNNKITFPRLSMLIAGVVISLLGLGLGTLIGHIRRKRRG